MASHDSRRQQQQQQQQQPYLRWRASPSNRRNNASTSRIHPVQPRRIAVLDNQHLVAPQTTILEHQYQQQQYQQLEEEEEERYQAPSRPVPVLISPDNSPMAIASSEDPMLLLGSGAEDTTGNTTCTAGTPKQTANNYSNFNNLRRKQRPLHNSHRKKVLHHITPLRREQQLPQSLSHLRHHPHPPPPAMGVQHRGNGVVLDLTSLFWQQTNPEKPQLPPSPTETATTAMSTAHNQHNNNNNHSTTNIQNNNSNVTPHTAGAAPTPTHGHYHHNHNHWRASPVSLLPQEEEDTDELSLLGQGWDTKSQTTQEALITERQCQALFQWLNYVLVGHEEGATATATGQHEEDKDTRGMGLTSSNNTTIQQSASQESSMDDHDDDKHDKVAASTSKRNNNASSATRAGARTPTKTRTITPPRTRNKSTKTTDTPQSQSRRASSFQYTQTYSHTQQQARHWFAHSQVWKDIRARIKSEITRKNFQLREDRNLYANVACRRQILELLLSYRPAWLTLALEILLDDTLIKHNNSNKATDSYALPSNSQLKQCITQRILHDDKLLNKYNQGRGSRVPSGQFEEQYLAELRPLVLYRLMVLIFFLDRAATKFQHVLGNVFAPSASVKSTKDVLVILCREFMSKQGDIVKQLTRANLPCTYEQHPLQEIDFTVTNFAVDLRDGVRLCRILEVLWMSSRKEEFPLLQQLRIPAISRLQKIHNVNVALQTLTKECSVNADSVWVLPRDMQAHHIVDGHRRMVMRLIWTIVLMHCFDHSDILTREQLQLEIRQLQREHSSLMDRERQEHLERQSSLLLLEQETDAIDSVTAMSDDEGELFSSPSKSQSIVRKPASSSATHSHEHFSEPRVATSGSFSFDGNESCNSGMPLEEIPLVQQWKSLLFHWCQQVCMIVEEKYSSTDDKKPSHSSSQRKWTSSDLINGKAVCCLIHYYHPELLSAAELRLNSTFIDGPPTNIVSGPEMAPKQSFQRTRDQMCNPKIAPDYYTRLAHRRLSDLGGMIFLPYSHQKHSHHHGRLVAPLGEEKSTVVFIYHVCARLLESRHQVEALTRIQCWYRYRRWLSSWKRKRGAARVALTHWKDNKNNYYQNRRKKYARSTRIIESFVASNFDKLLILKERRLERELQGFAATTIQVCVDISDVGIKYAAFLHGYRS